MVVVSTSFDFASWRHDVSKWRHFLRKNEISIYTFKCSGIMENWIKHELFHSNNEVSWWHDMSRDNMSSHDIRYMTYVIRQGMTYEHKIWHLTSCICRCEWTGEMILLPFRKIFRSRNTFLLLPIGWPSHMHSRVTLKLKVTSWYTWPLLSLLVFVLSQWFFGCFVRILGQEIHSNYRHLCDLHAWPWNWMSRHGQRDICDFCLYLCYRKIFFFVL